MTVVKEYDEITGNFFIGNYYGQEAIDNDDGSVAAWDERLRMTCCALSHAQYPPNIHLHQRTREWHCLRMALRPPSIAHCMPM